MIDRHHLVKLRSLEGDELHVRVFVEAAGGEDAVAQHEETFRIHAVVGGDALHRLLDTRDLGAVLEEDVTRLGGNCKRLSVLLFQVFFRML